MQNKFLTLIGSGIKVISHLTYESKIYIQQADRVLYLVNNPVMKEWIAKNSKDSQSLDFLYNKYSLRSDCYENIATYILTNLDKVNHLSVVLYGHPIVFAQPGLSAIKKAKKNGCNTKILPGISSEDCLYADLLIDPGQRGTQLYEATDFLIFNRRFDPNSHLILWQIDNIGIMGHMQNGFNLEGIKILVEHLHKFYNLDHGVILYEASQYPAFDPLINYLNLEDLPKAKISPITMLYVPPLKKNSFYDVEMVNRLNIKISDLHYK